MSDVIVQRRPSPPAVPPSWRRGGMAWRRRGGMAWRSWALVAGWAAAVCARLWSARARMSPAADPDESGYLAAARWLTGGPGGDLSGHTFYQGGYPLLLTPAYWFGEDPATVYALVKVINALVGAAMFPLGYALLRRLGLGVWTAMPVAWAAALLPAVTFFGAFALADAVLPAILLSWLLALDRCARRGGTYSAVGASLAACHAYAVHSRGAVMLAVHIVAFGFVALRRSEGRGRTLAAGFATVAAGCAAASVLNGLLRSALYPGGARDLAANIGGRVTTLEGQAWALSGAAGQLWYLVAGTWGLAGIGLAASVAALVRRGTRVETRLTAAALLATTLGIAYASAAALPDEHRVGNFAYGRYLSCVALVYTLVGAAALLRLPPAARLRLALAAGALMAVTGLWVTWYAGERLRTHLFIGFDFPEISFLTLDRTAFHLGRASLAALALLIAFVALSRAPAPWAVVAMGLLVVNAAAMVFVMGPRSPRPQAGHPLPGPHVGGVALDRSLHWEVRTRLLYPVWWTRMSDIDTRSERPAPDVCVVVVNHPDGTPLEATWPGHPAGWRPHPGRAWTAGWAAWRAPSCPMGPAR
ncbi:hypothetical protein SAMN04489712_104458 [Thermomonospora echinospora]|uniref:4-amino-4-deoxy-L-arabinose transferase n=1 Tax=Thermomonospora echinospora TaxID=1992 RepID=A0A1H5ZBV0_9ACTN|nr:hypothetical protein [Thermomonospora echinospora]SEG33510.1 hypothetical protein SAMN04489712_104458 [Thermomonospora echinospora]